MIKGRLTYEDLPEVYKRLSADLPIEAAEHVPKTQSRKGYDTTGYGYQFVVNRLNEVLFGHWRAIHKIVSDEISKTNTGKPMYSMVVHMIIQIGNWVFENGENKFEVLMEVDGYGGHESLEKSSAHKGSYTNAFKKAAAMLGVGRKAFEGTLDEDLFSVEAQDSVPQQRKTNQIETKQSTKAKPTAQKQEKQGHGDLGPWNDLAEANQQPAKKKAVNQRGRFFAIAAKRGVTDKQQKAIVFGFTGKESRSDVTDEEFKVIADFLETAQVNEIEKVINDAAETKKARQVKKQPDMSDITDDEIKELLGEPKSKGVA